jgi:hypothetical protein
VDLEAAFSILFLDEQGSCGNDTGMGTGSSGGGGTSNAGAG